MGDVSRVKGSCSRYLDYDENIQSVISQNNPFDKLDPSDDMYLVKTNKKLILFESKTAVKADKVIDKNSVIRVCKRDILTPGYEELIIEYSGRKYETRRKSISGMIVSKKNNFTDEFEVVDYDEINEDSLYPNTNDNTTRRYKEILGDVIEDGERVVKSISGRNYHSESKKYWLFIIYFFFMVSMTSFSFAIYTISDLVLMDIAAVGIIIMTVILIYVSYKLHHRWAGETHIVVTTDKVLKFRLDDRQCFRVKTFDKVEVVEESILFSKGVGLKEKDSERNSMMSKDIVMDFDADELENAIIANKI